jgi:hypothetical protein
MALKSAVGVCSIRERIIEDPTTGLTLQFVNIPSGDAPVGLRICGNLPHRNREILFDENGNEAGAGIALIGSCRASWAELAIWLRWPPSVGNDFSH